MKLSILIPTIVGREDKLKKLLATFGVEELDIRRFQHCDERIEFKKQPLEILIAKDDRQISIGEKRNNLLNDAAGDYVAFIDDDDRISENYINLLMAGIDNGVDCCSLVGEITFDGKNPKKFMHYLGCPEWFEKDGVYHRGINHLNCIRSSIAKQIGFTDKNHGEDYDFSMALNKSGLLKTEHRIDETIYYYDFKTNK